MVWNVCTWVAYASICTDANAHTFAYAYIFVFVFTADAKSSHLMNQMNKAILHNDESASPHVHSLNCGHNISHSCSIVLLCLLDCAIVWATSSIFPFFSIANQLLIAKKINRYIHKYSDNQTKRWENGFATTKKKKLWTNFR